MAKRKQKPKEPVGRVVARNRRARHDYEIVDTFEAGVVLTGSEVKSLRAGRVSLAEAFVRIETDEAWLVQMHIPPYSFARDGGHDPVRVRKLLLHRKQIDSLGRRSAESGFTIVPLEVYFAPNGLAKVRIGLGKGKRSYDKRQTEARRDSDRDIARALSDRQRY